MGWWKAMLGAGCVAPLAGCNLFQLAGQNLVNEPVQYVDECDLDKRLREEARQTWREVCRQYPDRSFTREFADGFVDGYADHLQNGGPPRPPAVPPLKYRRSKYFTPEGNLRVKDYLCGARYGAEVAAATGLRQFLTVPALLAEPRPDQPLNITVLPAPPDPALEPAAGEPAAPPPAPVVPLPPPKPLDGKKPAANPGDLPPPPAPPVVPKVEPVRPDPVPLGTPPKGIDPLPKFDNLPLGSPKTGDPPKAPPPRPSPLKPGETGTGLPVIDLPFPDFLAPPAGAIKPQGGTDADPGGVVPAKYGPPPLPVAVPPTDGPPRPRPPAAEPPRPRPAATEPPAR